MSQDRDDDVRDLLNPAPEEGGDDAVLTHVLKRVRSGVGQRDTLLFAIVRIWTALAGIFAPLFAAFAKTHAEARHGRTLGRDDNQDQKPLN